ncbi:conserved hypothetical protein [Frankia canadensis]|uniref:Uncharacterized protein n=1 Tax=Frankia canadensis TaxID=1836972 RepID=A0A2I2KYP0_9ACTN|nr:conserved hypothetical protein [Frankia canadensis]SOU58059.1 conserved hypothetical protein [Frankia canadensis]
MTREYGAAVLPALRNDAPPPVETRIGAFGLPIVFSKNATLTLHAATGDELRRASPLWIRLHPADDNRFHLLYHVFEAQIGPEDSEVNLVTGPHRTPLTLTEQLAYSTITTFLHTKAP